MKNELPELDEQDLKYGMDVTREVPDSWNLELIFPKLILSQEQMQDILRQEGIILLQSIIIMQV
jgi:hypothetical protein